MRVGALFMLLMALACTGDAATADLATSAADTLMTKLRFSPRSTMYSCPGTVMRESL
jgi:hypothetical protein